MPGKQSDEKRLYWQEIIDRQGASGVSVREFCAAEGISEPSFYAWRRRLGKPPRGGKRSETSSPCGSRNGQDFIPLKLLEPSGTVEVVHPSGYRIRVTGEVDVRGLQRILDVVDERSHG